MKKRILSLLLAVCFVCLLSIGAFAADTEPQLPCITDEAGLLTDAQYLRLVQMAQSAAGQFGVGVYIVTLDDYRDANSAGVYEAAYTIYHDYTMGVGQQHEGIMLLLSMAERDYAIFCYGKDAEYAFNDYGLEQLETVFLDNFAENDWNGGFEDYIRECASYLEQAEAGKPVSQSSAKYILIVCGISLLVAAIACAVMAGQMKSVHKKTTAGVYAVGGLELTQQFDQFTHRTESRRRIESSSSAGGESRSESGGGGSGRSGKF